MILACDVGGTKTNVALLDREPAGLRVVRLATYPSRDHGSLREILAAFMAAHHPVLDAAGFGVAGPVINHRVETTNLPWTVDGGELAGQLGLNHVSLLNDVEVQAWAVGDLRTTDQLQLQAGRPDNGNIALIAAGTGLGMSALLRGGGTIRSLASEGGHADYAAHDDLEIGLLRFLRDRFKRVSVERVLSGPGLVSVYQYLESRETVTAPATPERHGAGESAAAIGAAAVEGRSQVAERAVLLFLAAYGAEAGNWALRTMATGGVWLGGGIAHKLLLGSSGTSEAWRARARAAFMTRFLAKGRLSPLLEAMPVHVILTDEAPLLGAARFALAELG